MSGKATGAFGGASRALRFAGGALGLVAIVNEDEDLAQAASEVTRMGDNMGSVQAEVGAALPEVGAGLGKALGKTLFDALTREPRG